MSDAGADPPPANHSADESEDLSESLDDDEEEDPFGEDYEDDEYDMELIDDEWGEDGDEDLDFSDLENEESDASSVEEFEEALYADQLAATTADRFFHSASVPYKIPTFNAHFQTADGIAAVQDPTDRSITLASMDEIGVSVYRLPPAGEETVVGVPKSAVRIGGFQSMGGGEPYSISMSLNAKFVALGVDNGILQIFHVDAHAPHAPEPLPRDVTLSSAGPSYFYSPLCPPDRSVWPIEELYPPVMYDHKNTKTHAEYMYGLRSQGLDMLKPASYNTNENETSPDHAHTSAHIMAGDMYVRMVFSVFCQKLGHMVEMPHTDAATAALPPTAPSEGGAQASSPSKAPSAERGAVMLAGMLALGLPNEEAAHNSTVEPQSMVNGVRFGLVQGRERLLAADQSGYVYIFELPPENCPVEKIPSSMACQSLDAPSDNWKLRPVNAFSVTPNPLGVTFDHKAVTLSSVALGPFGGPCNLAVPSPDGRWIVVCCDLQKIILIDQTDGFSRQELPFDLRTPLIPQLMDPEIAEIGSQYAAWNSSSTLLAATCDVLRAVFVWNVGSGELVMRVEGHMRPILPVSFAPWDDQVVIYAEESKQIHVRRVIAGVVDINYQEERADPTEHMQLLRLGAPQPLGGAGEAYNNGRRITGLAVTPQGDLLIGSKQQRVHRYMASIPWSVQRHHTWPPRFRLVVKELLLCATRKRKVQNTRRNGDNARVDDLPMHVLHQIIASMAGSRSDWLFV